MPCQNCGSELTGAFCAECGQRADTRRFQLKPMVAEAMENFFHLRRGLPFTLKQVLFRPGSSVREYIEGHRTKWYKPLAFIMLMGLVAGVVMQYANIEVAEFSTTGNGQEEAQTLMQERYNELMARNYTLFQIFMLPLYALTSFFIFRSSRFNYAENLVLNCYVLGTTALISTLMMALIHFTPNETAKGILAVVMFAGLLVYHVVSYVRFFRLKSTWAASILAVVSYLVTTLLVVIVVASVMMIYLFTGGIEDLQREMDTVVRTEHRGAFQSEITEDHLISIALPSHYYRYPEKRWPVLYMHDGQNLFEADSSQWSHEEWGVDEALTYRMVNHQSECIVVGVHSSPHSRWQELAPQKAVEAFLFDHPQWQDTLQARGMWPLKGDDYLRMLVEEIKPRIDAKYHTLTGPEHTFVAGSSMGGLMSMYAVCEYPEVFSAAGCVSTHWPLAEPGMQPDPAPYVLDYLASHLPDQRRFWFDHGTKTLDAFYAPYQAQADEILKAQLPDSLWKSNVYPGTEHSEVAWKQRFPELLDFLLAPVDTSD